VVLVFFHFLDHPTHPAEGDVLDLTNALASDSELLAAFFKGLNFATVESKSVTENLGLALGENIKELAEHFVDCFFLKFLVGVVGMVVLDQGLRVTWVLQSRSRQSLREP